MKFTRCTVSTSFQSCYNSLAANKAATGLIVAQVDTAWY